MEEKEEGRGNVKYRAWLQTRMYLGEGVRKGRGGRLQTYLD